MLPFRAACGGGATSAADGARGRHDPESGRRSAHTSSAATGMPSHHSNQPTSHTTTGSIRQTMARRWSTGSSGADFPFMVSSVPARRAPAPVAPGDPMAIGDGYPVLRDHAVRTNRNRSGRSSRPCRGAASGDRPGRRPTPVRRSSMGGAVPRFRVAESPGDRAGGRRSEVEKLQRYPEEAGLRHRPKPDRIQVFEQARHVDIAGA